VIVNDAIAAARSSAGDGDARVVSGSSAAESQEALMWEQSSQLARRGNCKVCLTPLLMDYEWFEPNTIWLQDCYVITGSSESCGEGGASQNSQCAQTKVIVEDFYHTSTDSKTGSTSKGKVDFDVCWDSRNDACTLVVEKAAVSDMGGPAKLDSDGSSTTASECDDELQSESGGPDHKTKSDTESGVITRRGIELINFEHFELDAGKRTLVN